MANDEFPRRGDSFTEHKNSILPTEIDPDLLVDLLHAGAGGIFLHEASRRLLARHGYWLKQSSFLKFVTIDGDPPEFASIHWKPLLVALDDGSLQADHEQISILQIAGSLATEYPVYLHYASEGIDKENIKHVAEAIMYADGFLESIADPRA